MPTTRPGRDALDAAGSSRAGGRDRGSVTAEMAVVLPALLVLVGMALALLAAVITQLRCLDAAAVGARLAARGEDAATVRAAIAAVAPSGAVTDIAGDATAVTVTVRSAVELPIAGALLPPLQVSRSFVEAVEPGAVPPTTTAAGGAP